MNNITSEVKGNKLILTIDISPASCEAAPPSMSGKTLMVASANWQEIEPSPPGWKLNYSLTVNAKRAKP